MLGGELTNSRRLQSRLPAGAVADAQRRGSQHRHRAGGMGPDRAPAGTFRFQRRRRPAGPGAPEQQAPCPAVVRRVEELYVDLCPFVDQARLHNLRQGPGRQGRGPGHPVAFRSRYAAR
ncbi:MAG: hypothetical protein WDN06_16110 [Asticcacaulis sp.]